MRKRLLYVANVASLEIHGTGVAVSRENRHPSLASHVVLPFIGVFVPVQFAQSPGMVDNACFDTPRFLLSTLSGVFASQSANSTVSYSEKAPSSNTSRNSQPSGPKP